MTACLGSERQMRECEKDLQMPIKAAAAEGYLHLMFVCTMGNLGALSKRSKTHAARSAVEAKENGNRCV